MSEITEKDQVSNNSNNTDTKKSDESTWNVTIKYARKELNECLDDIPLTHDDPSLILKTSERLKSLACTLDKLGAAYDTLGKIRQCVSKK